MKIDSLIPSPVGRGRARVGVDVRIMFLLTSILSLRGEKRYWLELFSIPLFFHLQKGGITPLWKRGARGDFLKHMSS